MLMKTNRLATVTADSFGGRVTKTCILTVMVALLLTSGCSMVTKTPVPAAPPAQSVETPQTPPSTDKAPSATKTPEPTQEANPRVTCVHESDTRVLQLQAAGAGCSLNYTKYGKTASVAKSTTGIEPCEKVEQKIRSKLESVGYDCK
jgi:hypothetical protein